MLSVYREEARSAQVQQTRTIGGMKSAESVTHVLRNSLLQSLTALSRESQRVRLLVALSGGPDSTALLLTLADMRDDGQLSCDLFACHVNYGLRGRDSDLDEQFCREICGGHNIALATIKLEPGRSSEAALRKLRYDALEDTAKANHVQAILTAHTLDDQIETMLFRMFRGTAVSGLTGIPARRLSRDGLNIIRPFLSLRRKVLQDYLDDKKVAARVDATNLKSDYARNYIRNELVPRIEARFQGFSERLEQLRQVLAAEDLFLQETAADVRKTLTDSKDEFELSADLLARRRVNHAIIRRLLAHELKTREIEVSYERVEKLLGFLESGAGAISLDERWDGVMEGGKLVFKEKTTEEVRDESHVEHAVRIPGQTMALDLGYLLRVERVAEEHLPNYEYPASNDWNALVDLSKCSAPFVLRVRRTGDVIIPFGMREPVRLKQFLRTRDRAEAALSPAGNAIVLADQEQVLWVPGVGLSNAVRVHYHPTHALRLMRIAADDVKLS